MVTNLSSPRVVWPFDFSKFMVTTFGWHPFSVYRYLVLLIQKEVCFARAAHSSLLSCNCSALQHKKGLLFYLGECSRQELLGNVAQVNMLKSAKVSTNNFCSENTISSRSVQNR